MEIVISNGFLEKSIHCTLTELINNVSSEHSSSDNQKGGALDKSKRHPDSCIRANSSFPVHCGAKQKRSKSILSLCPSCNAIAVPHTKICVDENVSSKGSSERCSGRKTLYARSFQIIAIFLSKMSKKKQQHFFMLISDCSIWLGSCTKNGITSYKIFLDKRHYLISISKS